ncbi:hypothetical protein [Ochrovirga pacifica]|uniref:hypothetical protein n=1 Tax=Ochrovirga pacifica TaxID=1042376 RepID=UPI0002557FD4|nr:hypothetical protein [Ochrovirga pacifica]
MKRNQSIFKFISTATLALFFSTFAFAQDKVSFANNITSVANQKPLTFEIDYIAEEDRDINLDLKDSNNKWVAGKKVTVKKGKGTVSIKLNKKGKFEDGNNYAVGVAIRPTGSTWKENLDRKSIKPFTIGGQQATPTEDSVRFVDTSKSIENKKPHTIEIAYTALEDRLIAVELKEPKKNQWIAGGRKKVTKGAGTVKINLYSKNAIPSGDNYHLIIAIRPVGASWKENIDKKVQKPFSVK